MLVLFDLAAKLARMDVSICTIMQFEVVYQLVRLCVHKSWRRCKSCYAVGPFEHTPFVLPGGM